MPPPSSATGRARLRRVEETSAGGLILDQQSSDAYAALIGRRDRSGRMLWSLPKGHIEAGETAEQAAIREVREETGLTGRILGPLGTIDFWFVAGGARIHKTVHHFLLLRLVGSLSDTDVEVDAVTWVPLIEVAERLAYADERRLLDEVPVVLAETA
ncbi:NUDIX hydrolase [Frankia sp. R82]|uniref:NUDIX hydrolase n=1 Tax=Frankia sp. R82 TaxID=2950553 RepID=UPI002042C89F|nr:NUDIX hydrolase [Frankia sp. R82]MCM3887397.1 NUDIX hydrolase [Frankia sp. R82]